MVTFVKGITIAPSTPVSPIQVPVNLPEVPSLSLKDMNKLPIQRTSATQTQHSLVHQQGTQFSPSVVNKATDANDLIRLVHKMSQSEVPQKRDQMVHTKDLVELNQIGTNTPPVVVPTTRSTASNTSAIFTKNVGVNCEYVPESLGTVLSQRESVREALGIGLSQLGNGNGGSKIPRPSPMAQRKFVRQETFTVKKPAEDDDAKECPAEMLLK